MTNLILPLSGIYASNACLLVVIFLAFFKVGPSSTRTVGGRDWIGPAESKNDYIPVFLVTTAAVCLFYRCLFQQSFTVSVQYAQLMKEYKESINKKEATVTTTDQAAISSSSTTSSTNNESTSLLKSDSNRIKNGTRSEIKPSYPKLKYSTDNFAITAANRSVGNLMEQMIPFLVSLYSYATFVSVAGAVKCGWAWIFFRSYYSFVFKKPFPAIFTSTLPAYACIWYMLFSAVCAAVKIIAEEEN